MEYKCRDLREQLQWSARAESSWSAVQVLIRVGWIEREREREREKYGVAL